MNEQLNLEWPKEEPKSARIGGSFENYLSSPRWKPADFRFGLSGIIDLRSASGSGGSPQMPVSNPQNTPIARESKFER